MQFLLYPGVLIRVAISILRVLEYSIRIVDWNGMLTPYQVSKRPKTKLFMYLITS